MASIGPQRETTSHVNAFDASLCAIRKRARHESRKLGGVPDLLYQLDS